MSVFTVLVVLAVLVGLAILMGKYLRSRQSSYPVLREGELEGVLAESTERQRECLPVQREAAIQHLMAGKAVRIVGDRTKRLCLGRCDKSYAMRCLATIETQVGTVYQIETI